MKCGKRMEYVPEESEPRNSKSFYTCWPCDTSYIVIMPRETMVRVEAVKAH